MLLTVIVAHVVQAAANCVPLRNQDIFSTVEVQVGTPPQRFEVVADTGSNTLIVQSCACQDLGSCPASFGRCFRGAGRSSTFAIERDASKAPQVWILKYGSGDIEALVASDKASLGNYSAFMNSSLLLMVSQALNFDTSFQGILGLGVPNLTAKIAGSERQEKQLRGFLEEAKVQSFSLCFNNGADGVLGLDVAPPRFMRSTSQEHWALQLRAGVKGRMVHEDHEDQLAIPDSGTTLITGPTQQIASMMESICDQWPRCHAAKEDLVLALAQVDGGGATHGPHARSIQRLLTAYTRSKRSAESPSGALALQMLLEDCGSWKHGVDLDAEMPAIQFQLRGAEGRAQMVEIKPSSYVAEVSSTAMVWTQKYLLGILPYWWPEVEEESSCVTLLGSAPYVGDQLWILGTPLFYGRRVHFDLRGAGIGFSDDACGTCDAGEYTTKNISLIQGRAAMRQLSRPGRLGPVVSRLRF